MNKKIFVFLLASCLITLTLTAMTYWGKWAEDQPNFDSKSADFKQNYMWEQIQDSAKYEQQSWPAKWSALKIILPVFIGGQDLMPVGHYNSEQLQEGREKKIHSVGSTFKFKFEWSTTATSSYTGLFKQADYGIGRMSGATNPSKGWEEAKTTAPGLSIKILRDKVESGNFVSMYSILGQNSKNFFENPFSNHISSPENTWANFKVNLLVKKFKTVDSQPGLVGLSNFGGFEQNGAEVPKDQVKVPFVLVFQPNPVLTKMCDGVGFDGLSFGCLRNVNIGTKLYKIFGVDEPIADAQLNKDHLKFLGYMTTTSEIVNSKFADTQLQYKHVFWADEVQALNKQATWGSIVNDDFMMTEGADKYRKFLPKWNDNTIAQSG